LQCVAVCCSVLQCVAVCCSVLQCVAVCCSVLQCFLGIFELLHDTDQGVSVRECENVGEREQTGGKERESVCVRDRYVYLSIELALLRAIVTR